MNNKGRAQDGSDIPYAGGPTPVGAAAGRWKKKKSLRVRVVLSWCSSLYPTSTVDRTYYVLFCLLWGWYVLSKKTAG
jgi:hypothetical protein